MSKVTKQPKNDRTFSIIADDESFEKVLIQKKLKSVINIKLPKITINVMNIPKW